MREKKKSLEFLNILVDNLIMSSTTKFNHVMNSKKFTSSISYNSISLVPIIQNLLINFSFPLVYNMMQFIIKRIPECTHFSSNGSSTSILHGWTASLHLKIDSMGPTYIYIYIYSLVPVLNNLWLDSFVITCSI